MNRNDSPRLFNKLYAIIIDIVSNNNSLDKYPSDFLEGLQSDEETCVYIKLIKNLNLMINENRYYYRGYPTGNYLKIFCKILDLWHSTGYFPVNFWKMDGLKDQTLSIIEMLNSQTSTLNMIFALLKENNMQSIYKLMINFLESIGMRGFMTCLGVRMTPGSCECLPPKRVDLFDAFNAVYKKIDNANDKEEKLSGYKTKITVGARALSKHSDRTKDNFWGVCKGSEIERNVKANDVFSRLMEECVWINIHFLPVSNKIIEIRNAKGYGIRWSLNGEFRGLIEPEELKDKNKDKKTKPR